MKDEIVIWRDSVAAPYELECDLESMANGKPLPDRHGA